MSLSDNQALVGRVAAKTLDVQKGDTLRASGGGNDEVFTVAAVLDRAPDGLDTGIFINIDAARRILGQPDAISAMRISGCWCSLDIDELAANVEKNLPGTKALTVEGMVKAQKSMIATVKEYSVLVNIVGFLIYSQTRRQLVDIALFLVVGAQPWMIVTTFVSVATLIGLTGGTLGWVMGLTLSPKIGALLIGTTLLVSDMGIAGVWTTILLSAGSALGPALAASKLNPADIFRKGLI